MREVALDERNPNSGRTVADARQQGPEQRHPEVPRDDGEHQVVHLPLADRPLRSVEHEVPAPRRSEQLCHQRQRPVLAEAHVLEEALQSTVGRRRQRRPGPLAGDVAKVHGACAHHADDEQA